MPYDKITGIQQIGIGVSNLNEAWSWYKKVFGMDVRVFEDDAVAALMLPYTGGEPRMRHAGLAVNIQGGGGFEIWQYKGRIPVPPAFTVQAGDIGIYAARVKSRNIGHSFRHIHEAGADTPGGLCTGPDGRQHFYVRDPWGNLFNVVESGSWFHLEGKHGGGTSGAVIGVSDIDRSLDFYEGILGYDHLFYDESGKFADLAALPGGDGRFRRVLLGHRENRTGAFSRLLGETQIELIQSIDRQPVKIFKDRFWGDLGFIHLCFDIRGMEELKTLCSGKGFPFTVDSRANPGDSFDMGEAAGSFSYVEDPDGTLIEFVETHKVPVLKAVGLAIDLKKRHPDKSLPDWLVKAMRFNRYKG